MKTKQNVNEPLPESDLFGFGPCKRLESPTVIVTPCDDPDHPPMPLAYFVNGYQRHHEKLSGMAGDWMDNRLHACEPNAEVTRGEVEVRSQQGG